jgi:hypothetical protein
MRRCAEEIQVFAQKKARLKDGLVAIKACSAQMLFRRLRASNLR